MNINNELQMKANEEKMNNLFILTGQLVSNAATCDVILFSVFFIITECEKEIAQAIYYATESLPMKKNLVLKTLKVSKYKKHRKIIERIILATEKVNKKRNELSHVLLRVADDNEIVCQNPRHQQQSIKRITKPYLDSLLKDATYAWQDCLMAAQELSSATGKQCPINL